MTAHLQQRQQIEGGLLGLLVGDALGVPYEFHSPEGLPPMADLEMTPPAGFPRSHPHVPPGTWSDDGAQALCLLASLQYRGELDLVDLGNRFLNWRELGYMAVDGDVFDVGNATEQALGRLRAGVPPERSGGMGESSNGNGSLMRALPLTLWHRGSDEELVRDAMRQSLPTHAHPRAQVCCAVYCLWARRMLQQHQDPWGSTLTAVTALLPSGSAAAGELEALRRESASRSPRGTGYVVDTLLSAKAALEQPDFESVVKAAVAMGNDTDTTACVAGGLAGLRWGVNAIPQRWRALLRGRDLVEPLLGPLLQRES